MALRCAAHCCTAEEFIAVLDNVVHLGLGGGDDLADLLVREPAHIRGLLRRCARAESGIESLTRVRLVALGYRVRSQVVVPGVGRIDLLVGECLALEVDGRESHATPTGHNSDRRRDRRLLALGYTPMRLTWESVMLNWDEVVQEITAALRLGVHRRGPGRASRRRQLPRSA
jgi:very-short-patch-repair endonuclease